MKFTIALMVVALAMCISAAPLDDKFKFIYKSPDGVKLGCFGNINAGQLKITHYIVDGSGFRKILEDPEESPATYQVKTKAGQEMSAGFRPLGDETDIYFPDECFI